MLVHHRYFVIRDVLLHKENLNYLDILLTHCLLDAMLQNIAYVPTAVISINAGMECVLPEDLTQFLHEPLRR